MWWLEDENEGSNHLHELEDKVQKDLEEASNHQDASDPRGLLNILREKWQSELEKEKGLIRSQSDLDHMTGHLRGLLPSSLMAQRASA